MSRKILKAIAYLCKEYKSKAVVWYRNFLVKKFKPECEDKIPSYVNRNFITELNNRFYYTYLSEAVCKNPINYEDFITEKNKKRKYYKYYTQLDHEVNTKTRLYEMNTSDYYDVKQKKKKK